MINNITDFKNNVEKLSGKTIQELAELSGRRADSINDENLNAAVMFAILKAAQLKIYVGDTEATPTSWDRLVAVQYPTDFTQGEAAEIAGISRWSINKYLHSTRATMRLNTALKISKSFKKSITIKR